MDKDTEISFKYILMILQEYLNNTVNQDRGKFTLDIEEIDKFIHYTEE